ncbi:MAG: YtxH domain-containing protein [Ignavibacteria bacterium]|nr:YtxH domain-containing protein [Ignavibacteria bacterium]
MTTIKRVNEIFLSFLIGGVIGSSLALLYAPVPGKKLRNDIRKKTNEIIKDGKEKANYAWNEAKEKAEKILESANDVISTNVDKIVHNTENIKDAVKSGINAYKDERNS